jgi:hypothetical protein
VIEIGARDGFFEDDSEETGASSTVESGVPTVAGTDPKELPHVRAEKLLESDLRGMACLVRPL